jgi:hypothetical protein
LEKEFVESFLAMAYFRVPEFRIALLESLEKTNTLSIPEWRSYKLILNQFLALIKI